MNLRNIVLAGVMIGTLIIIVAACAPAAPTATPVPPTAVPKPTTPPVAAGDLMKPSNGNTTPGAAITQNMKGDPTAGAQVFVDNCKKCHGDQGKGGIENPGSKDGTIPPLNPVDDPEAMNSGNPEQFALVLDTFIEHGSTPEGDKPKEVMDAWGDKGKLTPQQIADVIAYIVSLNR